MRQASQAATGTLRVEVVDENGPAGGATVAAGDKLTTTDASGVATFVLPAGSIAVVARKDARATADVRAEVIAGSSRTVRLALAPRPPAPAIQSGVLGTARSARPVDEQAHPVSVIERDRIEAAMLRTPGNLSGLFNVVAGVHVQTTSPELGTQMLRIQGLPGHYTRLLLDGVHVYSDRPGGDAVPRTPALDLDRIDVIRGPASAFYGSDSPAGAINFFSRVPGGQRSGDVLFSQSGPNATDGAVWFSTPAASPSRKWGGAFLASAHRQAETDVDDDGWSDVPSVARGTLRQRVYWDNGQGKTAVALAGVTIEKREGGSAVARQTLETRTGEGSLIGQKVLDSGYILGGAGALFVQSRHRDFGDGVERDRLQTATIELTLRPPSGGSHAWLAGIASDWYAVRSANALPSTYVSTRPGIFAHDDWTVAPWLVLSGSGRVDHHNLYGLLFSPRGSMMVRGGGWFGRFSAGQGYSTPRYYMEDTESASLTRLTIDGPLEKETARSVSADVGFRTDAAALTVTVFRTQIDHPAQVDRTTFTLRSESEPMLTRGIEVEGRAHHGLLFVSGAYTFAHATSRGGVDLALAPRHTGSLVVGAEGSRGHAGVEVLYTGEQRLENNPYRSTSEAYVVVNVLGEYRAGRWGMFISGTNLTDVRQTDWDPIVRPSRDVDGRWTVDAWAPLAGRVINAGLRVRF